MKTKNGRKVHVLAVSDLEFLLAPEGLLMPALLRSVDLGCPLERNEIDLLRKVATAESSICLSAFDRDESWFELILILADIISERVEGVAEGTSGHENNLTVEYLMTEVKSYLRDNKLSINEAGFKILRKHAESELCAHQMISSLDRSRAAFISHLISIIISTPDEIEKQEGVLLGLNRKPRAYIH